MTKQQQKYTEALARLSDAVLVERQEKQRQRNAVVQARKASDAHHLAEQASSEARRKATDLRNNIAKDLSRRLRDRLRRRTAMGDLRWSVGAVVDGRPGKPDWRSNDQCDPKASIELLVGLGRLKPLTMWRCHTPQDHATMLQFTVEPSADMPAFLNRITPIIIATAAAMLEQLERES